MREIHDSPSKVAAEYGYYDCTDKIGPIAKPYLKPGADWPMYSYERPSDIVWNAIAGELHKRGWTDRQIKTWLQSKQPRWALDGELAEMLTAAAIEYATKQISDNDKS
jgi:hypothetical protein